VVGVGKTRICQTIEGKDIVMVLKDVGYAPKCRTNLVSLAKAQEVGCTKEAKICESVTKEVQCAGWSHFY